MGMAHRGRLNVLANIVGKSYEQIFREFEGELDPNVPQGSGDVKYHVGATGKFTRRVGRDDRHHARREPEPPRSRRPGRRGHGARQAGPAAATRTTTTCCRCSSTATPRSRARASSRRRSTSPSCPATTSAARCTSSSTTRSASPPAPTSRARPCTRPTSPRPCRRRSSTSTATTPKPRCASIRLAFEFRNAFKKDVVVDMVCYRRYGHNESDEPAFTQPQDVRGHQQSPFGAQALHRAAREPRRLHARRGREGARRLPRPARRGVRRDARERTAGRARADVAPEPERDDASTPACRANSSIASSPRSTTFPDGFEPHPKLARILGNRRTEFDGDADRLGARPRSSRSARCCSKARRCASPARTRRRGTFSQRHAVVVDHRTEQEYTPLAHLGDDAAPFMIYDSVLSEFAALGFEYGYSVADHDALVCWEAQFGDFANGGAGDHRPVHRRGRGQVGPAQRPHDAAPPRLRGPGPRALVGAARTVPRPCARRTTCASCTRRPPRSTSTCCAARCTSPTASR